MLFEANKTLDLNASAAATWQLVQDVARLSGCIPGVSQLAPIEAGRRYSALVTDSVGPFRIELPVEIELRQVEPLHAISADLVGHDPRGQARVRGTLGARIEPNGDRTRLMLEIKVEVLGRLAALGAAPMRRRADEIFEEFARRVGSELAGDSTSAPSAAPG